VAQRGVRTAPGGTVAPATGGISKEPFAGAVLGKNIWGVWPLIIWEATTAKRNLSEITIEPINSTSSRTTVSKNLGGLGKIWGPVPPGPNVEPPLTVRDRAE